LWSRLGLGSIVTAVPAAAAISIGPTVAIATVLAITAIPAATALLRLRLRLDLRRRSITAAVPGALAAAFTGFAALPSPSFTAIAPVAARAAVSLLALGLLLGDHSCGGAGLRRRAPDQREHHRGRDQTFHFLLRRALKRGPGLSLDSSIGLAG